MHADKAVKLCYITLGSQLHRPPSRLISCHWPSRWLLRSLPAAPACSAAAVGYVPWLWVVVMRVRRGISAGIVTVAAVPSAALSAHDGGDGKGGVLRV